MRYIVVFAQQEISYAVGFEQLADATDFLYWGYEEYDLVPFGIFDVFTGEVWPYEHHGQRTADITESAIRNAALDYLKAAIR